MKYRLVAALTTSALLPSSVALAEERVVADQASEAPRDPAPARPPAPYVAPFALRSAGPMNTNVRIDTVVAPYEPKPGQSGTAMVSMMSGGVKLGRGFGVVGKLGVIDNVATDVATKQAATNPSLGVTYGRRIGKGLLVSACLSSSLPFGAGGGNHPNADTKKALTAGNYARSTLEGAMFNGNDLAFAPGLDAAYVTHGFTFQLEATISESLRTKGEAVQTDVTKTNFVSGASVGYQIIQYLAVDVETRYQRWLTTTQNIQKDPSVRDNLTSGAGIRGIIPLGGTMRAMPGIGYAHGWRGPTGDKKYEIAELDLRVSF